MTSPSQVSGTAKATSEQIIRAKTEQQLRAAIAKARANIGVVEVMQKIDYENVGHPNLEMAPSKRGIEVCEAIDARMTHLYRLGMQLCVDELARRGLSV